MSAGRWVRMDDPRMMPTAPAAVQTPQAVQSETPWYERTATKVVAFGFAAVGAGAAVIMPIVGIATLATVVAIRRSQMTD